MKPNIYINISLLLRNISGDLREDEAKFINEELTNDTTLQAVNVGLSILLEQHNGSVNDVEAFLQTSKEEFTRKHLNLVKKVKKSKTTPIMKIKRYAAIFLIPLALVSFLYGYTGLFIPYQTFYVNSSGDDQFELTDEPDENSYILKLKYRNDKIYGMGAIYNSNEGMIRRGKLKSLVPLVWSGEHFKYREDGAIIFKGNFVDNNRHGTFKYYYPNKALKQINDYQNGQIHGLLTLFETDGETISIQQIYNQGIVIGHGFKIEYQLQPLLTLSGEEQRRSIQLIWQTEASLRNKNFETVLKKTSAYLSSYPNHLLMREYRGDALMELGRFAEALDQFEFGLENRHPKKYRLHRKMARSYFLAGDNDTALLQAQKSIKTARGFHFEDAIDNRAKAYLIKGNSLQAEEDHPAAITAFSESLEEQATKEALNSRALSHLASSNDKAAQQDLNKSIKNYSKNNRKAYLMRAGVNARNNNTRAAYEDFRRGSSDDRNRFNWGQFLRTGAAVALLGVVFENQVRIVKFEVVFWGCLLQTVLSSILQNPVQAGLATALVQIIQRSAVNIVTYIQDVIFNTFVQYLQNNGFPVLAGWLTALDTFACMGSQPSYQ